MTLNHFVWRTRFKFYEPIQVDETDWFLAGYTLKFYGALSPKDQVVMIDDRRLRHMMFSSIEEVTSFIENLYVDLALAVEAIEDEQGLSHG